MKTSMDNTSTIAAISTPPGTGGIGIIRISGNNAFNIVHSIFRKSALKNTNEPFESHKLILGNIIDPENGSIVDEVLLAYMKAPHSYTREDVVEINAHSGSVVLNKIFELVVKHGARIAEPGEFTKRAFLNGRIDLIQAEAVADIILSKTERSLEIAVNHAKGYLGEKIKQIRNAIIEILVQMEASIDFSEDVEEDINGSDFIEQIKQKALLPVEQLINYYKDGTVIRDGLKLCIIGKPNVGKSSLLNCLSKNEKAIVTPIPGTTRDVVEGVIEIEGIPVNIYDTAGIHESDDPVETLGMNKAWDAIQNANVVLFMIDASMDIDKNDKDIFGKILQKDAILVINKSDLVDESFIPETPEPWEKMPKIKISALYTNGIEELKSLIKSFSVGSLDISESTIIPNIRQKIALEQSGEALNRGISGLKDGLPIEMASMDLKEAIDCLGSILGVNAEHDILDDIFSRFCIGK